MPPDDPSVRGAERRGGGDVLLLLELQHLAAHDTGHRDPVEQREGDEDAHDAGAEIAHGLRERGGAGVEPVLQRVLEHDLQQQDDQYLGDRVDQFDDTHHHKVDRAAGETGDRAVDRADDQHDQRRDDADDDRHARAVHRAGHDIAPGGIGAEDVGEHTVDELNLRRALGGRIGELDGLVILVFAVLDRGFLDDDQRLLCTGVEDDDALLDGLRQREGVGLAFITDKIVSLGQGRDAAPLQRRGIKAVAAAGDRADRLLALGVGERSQLLGGAVLIPIAVRDQLRPHEGEEQAQREHRQRHHRDGVGAEAAPGVAPVGHALVLFDHRGLFFVRRGSKIFRVQGRDLVGIDLEGAELGKFTVHRSVLL